jgi:hypothetical protein
VELMNKLQTRARIGRLNIPEPISGCWLFLGATRLGYGQLRKYKTGKDESSAGHGWHELTQTAATILAASGARPMYHRHNKPAPARLGDSVDDISGARA